MEPQRTVPADDATTLVPQQDPLPEHQVTAGSTLELSIANLVAELSHEIKNPLVAIKTFIQLLPGHINDPEFLSDFFGVAATSIDRIDYLTERMLEFAKLSQPRAMSIQLAAVLQEVMKKIGSLTPPLQINWNHDAFEHIPSLDADQEQVCYALENILFHIAHNAPAGQMVEFSVDETPATIALSMSYAGEKQAQGLAFSSAQGEMISDLNGLDLFLAHQVLQKNAIRCTKDTEHTKTIITIQFPRAMKIAEGDSSR
jgi:signal transduction histidine kinase